MLISGHRTGGPFCTHTESDQNREPGPHLVPQSFPRTPADTWEGNAGEHKIRHAGKPQNEHKNHTCDCLKATIANSNSQLMFREAPSLRMVPVLGLKDAKTNKQTNDPHQNKRSWSSCHSHTEAGASVPPSPPGACAETPNPPDPMHLPLTVRVATAALIPSCFL